MLPCNQENSILPYLWETKIRYRQQLLYFSVDLLLEYYFLRGLRRIFNFIKIIGLLDLRKEGYISGKHLNRPLTLNFNCFTLTKKP